MRCGLKSKLLELEGWSATLRRGTNLANMVSIMVTSLTAMMMTVMLVVVVVVVEIYRGIVEDDEDRYTMQKVAVPETSCFFVHLFRS